MRACRKDALPRFQTDIDMFTCGYNSRRCRADYERPHSALLHSLVLGWGSLAIHLADEALDVGDQLLPAGRHVTQESEPGIQQACLFVGIRQGVTVGALRPQHTSAVKLATLHVLSLWAPGAPQHPLKRMERKELAVPAVNV